jgi:hypothetical protein
MNLVLFWETAPAVFFSSKILPSIFPDFAKIVLIRLIVLIQLIQLSATHSFPKPPGNPGILPKKVPARPFPRTSFQKPAKI